MILEELYRTPTKRAGPGNSGESRAALAEMSTPALSMRLREVENEANRPARRSVHFTMNASLKERLADTRVPQTLSARIAKVDQEMSRRFSMRDAEDETPSDVQDALSRMDQPSEPLPPDTFYERKIRHLRNFIAKHGPEVGIDPEPILHRRTETDLITKFSMTRTLGSYETRAIGQTVKDSFLRSRAGTVKHNKRPTEREEVVHYRLRGTEPEPVPEGPRLSVFHPMFTNMDNKR